MTADDAIKAEVLIVGAGPTGLLLANLLGAMGVNTRLVEAHDYTVQDPRAVSIDDESMRALQAAGPVRTVNDVEEIYTFDLPHSRPEVGA